MVEEVEFNSQGSVVASRAIVLPENRQRSAGGEAHRRPVAMVTASAADRSRPVSLKR